MIHLNKLIHAINPETHNAAASNHLPAPALLLKPPTNQPSNPNQQIVSMPRNRETSAIDDSVSDLVGGELVSERGGMFETELFWGIRRCRRMCCIIYDRIQSESKARVGEEVYTVPFPGDC
jgi:hypothetical protein